MTISPGDVVRLKCGGPAMVVEKGRFTARDGYDEHLCVWIIHTMVAREWFPDAVLEKVRRSTSATAPPDRDLALNLWAAGAPVEEIVKASGYANAKTLKQILFRARREGDTRASLRRVGRKAGE